jgi:4-amino-4-deoxy-L-arabinose transferase-like glycosyltransferase
MEHKPFSLSQYVLPLFVIYAAALFISLNNWGVIETSEARYSEIAREMLATGDWIHPRLLNIYHYHKPPGTYWITALSYQLFGVNPFAARFFLQVSLLLQIVLIYRIAHSVFKGERTALLTAVIYGSMPLALVGARGLTTDNYLTTFVLLSIYCWLRWRDTGKVFWIYLIGIAMGAGFLIKGPLIGIVPLLFFIGMGGTQPTRKNTFHHILALFLFLGIGLSWYLCLAYENKNFISYFLWRQTVERVTNANVFRRHQPFWYYFAFSPLLALPWSIFFSAGLIKASWKSFPLSFRRLVIWCILMPILFFSAVSSKLVLYVLPIFPIVALCTGYLLVHTLNSQRMERVAFIYYACFSIAMGLVFLFHVDWGLDLTIMAIIAIIILSLLKWSRQIDAENKIMSYAFVYTIFLILYAAQFMGYNELKVNSTEPLANWLIKNEPVDQPVIVYNKLLPSLSFRLQRPIISINDGNHNLDRETNFESGEEWKKELYNIRAPGDSLRVTELLKQPSVLISKGELPVSADWIKSFYSKQLKIENWYIYQK